MPSFSAHEALERLFFGNSSGVSKQLDWPAAILGPKHRVLFHDDMTILATYFTEGTDAAMRVMLHIAADNNKQLALLAGMLAQKEKKKKGKKGDNKR